MDKKLPNHEGVLVASYDELAFSKDAVALFGEQIPELGEDVSSIHTQVGLLGSFIRKSKDGFVAKKIFDFLEQVLANPKATSEIENAVAISFLSASELRDPIAGQVYWRNIPSNLKHVLVTQEELDNAT